MTWAQDWGENEGLKVHQQGKYSGGFHRLQEAGVCPKKMQRWENKIWIPNIHISFSCTTASGIFRVVSLCRSFSVGQCRSQKPSYVGAGGSGMSTITIFSQCHFWSLIGRWNYNFVRNWQIFGNYKNALEAKTGLGHEAIALGFCCCWQWLLRQL